MKEYYPYIVIPQKVTSIMQEQIPLPKLPKLISAPAKVKRKFIGTLFFVVALSSLVTINLLNVGNIMITYFMFFVTLISLVAAIFEFAQHSKLKKHYEKEMKYYIERQKAYKKIKIEREKIESDNTNKDIVLKFRQEKIHSFFSSGYDTINAVHNEYSLAKKRFKLFLEEYFLDEILDNVKVVHRTKKINYVPDFIIQVENPKLNVSIEIEEPYSLSNVPENIQKDYEAKDRLRQRFANELGWLVIILSEEQSILHPTECCKYIEDSMSDILKDVQRNKDFGNIKDIKKQKMLTGEERANLKKEKYREGYLMKAGLMDKPLTKKLDNIKVAGSNENTTNNRNTTNDNLVKQNNKNQKTVIINKTSSKSDAKDGKSVAKSVSSDKNNDQMKLIRKYADKADTYKKNNENKIDKNKETAVVTTNKNVVSKQSNVLNTKTDEMQKSRDNKASKVKSLVNKTAKQPITIKDNELKQQQTIDKKQIKEQNNGKDIVTKQTNGDDKKTVEKILDTEGIDNEKSIVNKSNNIKDKKTNIVKSETVDQQSKKPETTKNAVKVEIIAKDERSSVEDIIRRRKQDIKNKLRNRNRSQFSAIEKPESKETKIIQPEVKDKNIKATDSKLKEKDVKPEPNDVKPIEKKSNIETGDSKSIVKDIKVQSNVVETELKSKKDSKALIKPDEQMENKVLISSQDQQAKNDKQKLIDSHHEKIEGAVFDKKWDELIDLCDDAITEVPFWAWAYYRRSTALGHKKEFSKAILDCNKAIAYNPTLAEAYYNRGTANFFLGQYMKAGIDYEKAISLNYVKKEEAHFNRGLCLLKLEHRRKAYREFLKAKEMGYQKADEIIKQHFSSEQ